MTIKRKELLALPFRKDDLRESRYDSLYLVPSGKKHDSGYMCIAIVGVRDCKPVEVAAYPDDIDWNTPGGDPVMHMDCEYPSGILHAWGHDIEFVVGGAYSSTDVTVVRKPR